MNSFRKLKRREYFEVILLGKDLPNTRNRIDVTRETVDKYSS